MPKVTLSRWLHILQVPKIFNVQDIQGKDEEAQQLLEDQILAECDNYTPPSPTERLEEAEKVLSNWKVPTTWNGNKAFYSCTEDTITMPNRDQFHTSEGMYSTWAHEQIHSTGHSSRLNRPLGGANGSRVYAREELVAGLGAYLLCRKLQINSNSSNHAAYLKHWIGVLQEGPDVLRKVLGDASKAVNLITNQQEVNTVIDQSVPPLPQPLSTNIMIKSTKQSAGVNLPSCCISYDSHNTEAWPGRPVRILLHRLYHCRSNHGDGGAIAIFRTDQDPERSARTDQGCTDPSPDRGRKTRSSWPMAATWSAR